MDGAAAAATLEVSSRPAKQVGAVYRNHGSGRDSSLEELIGPGKLRHVMLRSNRPR